MPDGVGVNWSKSARISSGSTPEAWPMRKRSPIAAVSMMSMPFPVSLIFAALSGSSPR